MSVLEFLRSHALSLPTLAKFSIAMAVIAGVPRLSRWVRLSPVVGLLLSGVLLGPHGLDLVGQNRPAADFFADLGKLLLMFIAGLEIDLTRFRQAQRRTVIFDLLTTSFPQLLGTVCRISGRLRNPRGGRSRLSARVAYTARSFDRDAAWYCSAGADHDHLRRDGHVGHAVVTGVRRLPCDLQE